MTPIGPQGRRTDQWALAASFGFPAFLLLAFAGWWASLTYVVAGGIIAAMASAAWSQYYYWWRFGPRPVPQSIHARLRYLCERLGRRAGEVIVVWWILNAVLVVNLIFRVLTLRPTP